MRRTAMKWKQCGFDILRMLLLLAGVLWLTMVGANVPSQLLSRLLMG